MSEFDHHVALKDWADLNSSRIPELRMLFHIPNGEYRGYKTGRKLKRMGVRAGVPDWCLAVKRGAYGSLWIELKKPGGKPPAHQADWINALVQYGQAVGICYSWEEARDVILKYLTLPNDIILPHTEQ